MNLQTTLYDFQQRAVDKLVKSRIGGLFMQMGTGKTRTAIEMVCLRQHRINRVVWFCPVSLKETIAAEITKHTDCAADDIYAFDERTRQRTLPLNRTWYIVGIESMSSSARMVLAANHLITTETFVILDESSYIKGHNARRTRRITAMASRAQYRLILTGTPMSQGIVDHYAQMRFLSPKILGYASFYSFAANHLEYSDKKGDRGRIIRSHNTGYIAAKIAPYIYQVTKKEVLDLPKKLFDTRYYHMTDAQRALYEEAKEAILLDIDPEDFTSTMIYRLFTALQQIVCGYWQRGRRRIEVEHRRIDVLSGIVADIETDEKVVIWAKYHYAINQITQRLRADYGKDSVAEYHGNFNERQRSAALASWRAEKRFLVATQAVGGHGLDFTESANVIFYANGFKWSEREQAEDRNHRIGQERPVTYINVSCLLSIDARIEDALARKGSIVDDFREQVNRVKDEGKAGLKRLIARL